MYGWRAKIGHVAPSRGDTLVYEFYKMLPEGFMILNSTGTIRQLVDADFERQLQRIEEAAADLVDNRCDSIIIGGSPLFTKHEARPRQRHRNEQKTERKVRCTGFSGNHRGS